MKKKLIPMAVNRINGFTREALQDDPVINHDGIIPHCDKYKTRVIPIRMKMGDVQVRYFEAMNNHEVLDFNSYLSPSDNLINQCRPR